MSMVVMLKRTFKNVQQIRQAIKAAAREQACMGEESAFFTRDDMMKDYENRFKEIFNNAHELAYVNCHGKNYFVMSRDIQKYGWGLEECLNYWIDTNQFPNITARAEFGSGVFYLRA